MNFDNRHVHEGGTFVTNFDPEQKALYQKAIEVYNKLCSCRRSYWELRNLAINESPGGEVDCPSYSLHYDGKDFDLSDFWIVFDTLQAAEELTNA